MWVGRAELAAAVSRLIFRALRNTARVLKNATSDEVASIEGRLGGAEFKDLHHLVSGQRGRAALEGGEGDSGLIWARLVVGLIHDVPTCAELIERMVVECRERLRHGLAAFNSTHL